jgi:FAD-dependent urate hydroxylase
VKVIVIGGGVAGLSTALALQRAGIEVTVYEAAPQLPAVGAALQVWVNGMLALRRLGLEEAVASGGDPLEEQEFRTSQDERLFYGRVADLARKNGVPPPVHARRGDLLQSLADRLQSGTLVFGQKFVAYENDPDGVTVRFADGHEERASLLVGADGINSTMRTMVAPGSKLTYRGYRYIRALTDYGKDDLLGKFVLWTGRGDRFGIHSGPAWIYWFGVVVGPENEPDTGLKRLLQERFKDFPPLVHEIIDKAQEEEINQAYIRDLDELERWSDGRVLLLGDAAHAVTPNMGRGSGEALEDAVALADRLVALEGADDRDSVVAALRDFEARRKPLTTEVLKITRKVGQALSWSNPAACAFRDLLAKRFISRGLPKKWEEEFAGLRSRADETPAARSLVTH